VLTGDGYQVYNLLASVLNTLQVRSTGVRYLTNRPVFLVQRLVDNFTQNRAGHKRKSSILCGIRFNVT